MECVLINVRLSRDINRSLFDNVLLVADFMNLYYGCNPSLNIEVVMMEFRHTTRVPSWRQASCCMLPNNNRRKQG